MKDKKFRGDIKDLHSLNYKSSDNGEVRYNCPYCDTIHGKSRDTEFKLHFNTYKGIGHCFKCESVVVNDNLLTKEELLNYVSVTFGEDKFLSETIEKYDNQLFDVSCWKSVLENEISKNYITVTRKIREDVVREFDIRVNETPELGLVFLDTVIENYKTKFFQIRNITEIKHKRHLFMKNVVKPISWIDRVTSEKDVILCEGFISSLAAYQHLDKQVHPIVATGKNISKLQKHLVSKIKNNIRNLIICYDGGFVDEAIKTANILYNFNFPIQIMSLPKDKDPNDISKKDFIEFFDKRVDYTPYKKNIIKFQLNNLVNLTV